MDCSRTAHTILSGLGKKVASLTTLTRAEERQGDAPHSLNDQLITRKWRDNYVQPARHFIYVYIRCLLLVYTAMRLDVTSERATYRARVPHPQPIVLELRESNRSNFALAVV